MGAVLLGLLGNSAIISLAVQLIENYIASSNANDAAKAAAVQLAKALSSMGVKNLKSRFEDELAQKQSAASQWDQQEAAAAQPPPAAPKVVKSTVGTPSGQS